MPIFAGMLFKVDQIYNFGQNTANKRQLKNKNEQYCAVRLFIFKVTEVFCQFFVPDCQYFLPPLWFLVLLQLLHAITGATAILAWGRNHCKLLLSHCEKPISRNM
jgi:hypothetical protein